MESQEEEYEHSIWEIYRKEWATANPEKRVELNKRMLRWQELMKNGWTASQAYYRVMQEESDYRVMEEPSDKRLAVPSGTRMRKAPLVFLSLALVAAIVYCVVITGDRDALNTELESAQSGLASTKAELSPMKQTLSSTQSELSSTKQSLASTQTELGSTKQSLASTQAELGSTKQSLASTQAELSPMKQTLASTQSELSSTKQSLASTQTELSSTKQTLTSVQNELGTTRARLEATDANLKLYEETLGIEVLFGKQPLIRKAGLFFSGEYVYLDNNPNATNPTWQELKAFLLADPTDDEYYSEYFFNCTDFAEMLHNNAEVKGIKAAFVAVTFSDSDIGHTLNAFKTTDKGLVYVDCTGGDFEARLEEQLYGYTIEYDRVAYVWKEEEYYQWSIDKYTFLDYRYYEPYRQTSDWERCGIVESIKIYW